MGSCLRPDGSHFSGASLSRRTNRTVVQVLVGVNRGGLARARRVGRHLFADRSVQDSPTANRPRTQACLKQKGLREPRGDSAKRCERSLHRHGRCPTRVSSWSLSSESHPTEPARGVRQTVLPLGSWTRWYVRSEPSRTNPWHENANCPQASGSWTSYGPNATPLDILWTECGPQGRTHFAHRPAGHATHRPNPAARATSNEPIQPGIHHQSRSGYAVSARPRGGLTQNRGGRVQQNRGQYKTDQARLPPKRFRLISPPFYPSGAQPP